MAKRRINIKTHISYRFLTSRLQADEAAVEYGESGQTHAALAVLIETAKDRHALQQSMPLLWLLLKESEFGEG